MKQRFTKIKKPNMRENESMAINKAKELNLFLIYFIFKACKNNLIILNKINVINWFLKIEKYKNGNIYEGDWNNDLKEG